MSFPPPQRRHGEEPVRGARVDQHLVDEQADEPTVQAVRIALVRLPRSKRRDRIEAVAVDVQAEARRIFRPADEAVRVLSDVDWHLGLIHNPSVCRCDRAYASLRREVKYEADLDLSAAGAEAGTTPDEFRKRIESAESLRQSLGALRVAGGTVSRQIWVQTFGEVVREFKLGTLFRGNVNGAALADNTGELDPLEASGNTANAVAFRPDGKFALIASADRSVRLWDVEAKRDGKRLIGHTATVWAAAFSPDNTKAISGSVDGTARIWDLANGQELFKLDGHDALVSAVAFGADGTKTITGGLRISISR